MKITVFTILIVIALLMAIASTVTARYPLLSVAVILVTVALLIGA